MAQPPRVYLEYASAIKKAQGTTAPVRGPRWGSYPARRTVPPPVNVRCLGGRGDRWLRGAPPPSPALCYANSSPRSTPPNFRRFPQKSGHLLGVGQVGALAPRARVGDGDVGGFHARQDHPETHGQRFLPHGGQLDGLHPSFPHSLSGHSYPRPLTPRLASGIKKTRRCRSDGREADSTGDTGKSIERRLQQAHNPRRPISVSSMSSAWKHQTET